MCVIPRAHHDGVLVGKPARYLTRWRRFPGVRLPQRNELVVVLALLLVAVPLWAPPLDVTGYEHGYRAAELSASNGTLTVDYRGADSRTLRTVEGLDCFPHREFQRHCLFEGATLDGNVTGRAPGVEVASSRATVESRGEYVVLDGRTYRRRAVQRPYDLDEPVRYDLWLERVEPSAALDAVATSERFVTAAERTAVRQGAVVTEAPLMNVGRVFEVDGRYYVLYRTTRTSFLIPQPGLERALEGVAVVAGAFLLLRQDSSSSRSS